MKKQIKRIASVILTAALLLSVVAAISVSAAESGESVGAATVNATSNFCTAAAVSGNVGKTVTVRFNANQAVNVVDLQWGMNYDTDKLQLLTVNTFAGTSMTVNTEAEAYNVQGSVKNEETPYEIAEGRTMFTLRFKVLADGAADVDLTFIHLTNRTETGDKVIIHNGKEVETTSFTVEATSNFFSAASVTADDISMYEDADGDVYVTVAYKLCAKDKYLIGIDIDELTYDPAVLEWKEAYNRYGRLIDIFPFAAENGLGAGTVQKTGEGRIVGNFSALTPPACAYNEDGSPVTVVKAVFKVLDKNAVTTTVNCKVDTLTLCDVSEQQPYMQYLPVDKCVVDDEAKALADFETTVNFDTQTLMIGDVNNDGTIDVRDVTLLQEYLAEFSAAKSNAALNMENADNFGRCDADLNGIIDIRDVTEIQRYLAELPYAFQ